MVKQFVYTKHCVKLMLLAFVMLFSQLCNAATALRRPISPDLPMWIIHIDVWNTADPQKIIDLVPADIKPYVVMNLSLSCQYDTQTNRYKMPQHAMKTFESWARVCSQNKLWFMCQPASGGHTHIMDDDMTSFEYFFKNYPNFLGWNYAEQFWGFDERNDRSSSTFASRMECFAKLMDMSVKYGGYLTVSFCGNQWSSALNPVAYIKKYPNFGNKLIANPDNFILLYKYTTSACWNNNESVTLGAFISGLTHNYGVRYDNCGWNGATDHLWGSGHKYPGAVGIAPVLEQTALNGGTVWDGPELIWTEDFRELGSSNWNGFTRRNWGTYPNYDNIWVDMFRKIIDGTIRIPSRDEVIERTKIAFLQDGNWQSDNTNNKMKSFGTPEKLYHGLYLSKDGNGRDGWWDDNYNYFKSTGRYAAIPVVYQMYDNKAKQIPLQVKYSEFNNRWGNEQNKVNEFNRYYPEISTGGLFVARQDNTILVYYPYRNQKYGDDRKAYIPLQYSTCDRLEITLDKYSSGLFREYNDHFDIYLNNFRDDSTQVRTDDITVHGCSSKPTYNATNRASGNTRNSYSISEEYNNGSYTVHVKHVGPVDLKINCRGNKTPSKSNPKSAHIGTPRQPNTYYGTVQYEAEDMDRRSVQNCQTNPYSFESDVSGHAGMGYMVMGTNSNAALHYYLTVAASGQYRVKFRYSNTGGQNRFYHFYLDNENNDKGTVTFNGTGSKSNWQESENIVDISAGKHDFWLKATGSGSNVYIDNLTVVPVNPINQDNPYIEGDDGPSGGSSGGSVATFNYDKESGIYAAKLSDLSAGGDLSFDSSTGVISLPAGKSGTLTLNFGSADFRNVSNMTLDYTGDDVFQTLNVYGADGNDINGGAFWNSKYNLNYANYSTNNPMVSKFVWNATNSGSSTVTMNLQQILFKVNVLRAEKKGEIPFKNFAFNQWNGVNGSASVSSNLENIYSEVKAVAGGTLLAGDNEVRSNKYMDLTGCDKINVYGTDGVTVRVLLNRQTDNDDNKDYVELTETITNGVATFDLSSINTGYVHLNAMKTGWGSASGTIYRINAHKNNSPIDYYMSGSGELSDNAKAALADNSAMNIDATGLTNASAIELTSANPNCLIYVDNASRLSNKSNVVVKNGNSYTASNIVLVDGSTKEAQIAEVGYEYGSTSGSCTWAERNGVYTFSWTASGENSVELFHNLEGKDDFNELIIETSSFTNPWGVRFIDESGATIAEQSYWNAQNSDNLTKVIDINALFAAQNASDRRSSLRKVSIYSVSGDNGSVAVKKMYLSKGSGTCPFFAPYDITANAASFSTKLNSFTLLCIPFASSIPSGVTAYKISQLVDESSTSKNALITEVSSTEANRPLLFLGNSAVTFSANNVVVKATDNLKNGNLIGTYKTMTPATGTYVFRSLANVSGAAFYQKEQNDGYTLAPFYAYMDNANISSGIKTIGLITQANSISTLNKVIGGTPVEIFNAAGARVNAPQTGVNVVKMSDGTTLKLLVK